MTGSAVTDSAAERIADISSSTYRRHAPGLSLAYQASEPSSILSADAQVSGTEIFIVYPGSDSSLTRNRYEYSAQNPGPTAR